GSPRFTAEVDGQRRADLALATLRAHLRALPGVPVGLVGTTPLAVHLGPTRDHARVLDQAAGLPLDAVGANPEPLLGALCAGDDPPALLLVSDRPLDVAGCAVRRVDLGAIGPNQGVTRILLRPLDALGLAEIYVETAG